MAARLSRVYGCMYRCIGRCIRDFGERKSEDRVIDLGRGAVGCRGWVYVYVYM